jgi:hypothetical protein
MLAKLVLVAFCAITVTAIRKLVPGDDFGGLLDIDKVIIIQYEDTKDDDWLAFDSVYREVASHFEQAHT